MDRYNVGATQVPDCKESYSPWLGFELYVGNREPILSALWRIQYS